MLRFSNRVQSTVDIFVDQEKINFFRVTFLMVCHILFSVLSILTSDQERMCPLSFGLGSRFNETVRRISCLSVYAMDSQDFFLFY